MLQGEDVLNDLESSGRDDVAMELRSLESIYGSLDVHAVEGDIAANFTLPLTVDEEDSPVASYCIIITAEYPHKKHAYISLVSDEIGGFAVAADLVQTVSDAMANAPWSPGDVILFEAMEAAREACIDWWKLRKTDRENRLKTHEDHKSHLRAQNESQFVEATSSKYSFISTPPLVDRKSVFIGHVARVSSPAEAHEALGDLINSDRKIARATHNISAFRIVANGITYQDNDDDGETHAGGRLAHLLSILEANGVLVVVSRWFGGILLGPERFKWINQAARDALQLGGYIS